MKHVSKDDIRQAFSGVGMDRINGSVLDKCTSLVNSLMITPQAMVQCWEAFSLNKHITELSDHSWQSFQAELREKADRVVVPDAHPSHGGNTPMDDDDNAQQNDGAVGVRRGMGKRQVGSPDTVGSSLALVTPPTKRMATEAANKNNKTAPPASAVDAVASAPTAPTPLSKQQQQHASTATPPLVVSSSTTAAAMANHNNYTPPKYEDRTGAGKVVLTLNPNDYPPSTTTTTSHHAKCGIAHDQFDTNIRQPYRHLFTTMEDRAKALDQHLVRLEDLLMERYQIRQDSDNDEKNHRNTGNHNNDDDENAIAPLEGVGVPRQERICCIGRVCNAAHEGRINATSVVLEGSKHLGGARIELDLTHLMQQQQPTSSSSSFSLFPGQIIGVEGMNSTGRKMTAQRICEGAAHGANKSTVQQLWHYHHDENCQNGLPLKLLTVCGPYTSSEDLRYDPLYDLMGVVLKERPDVVVMVGPFVDVRHKDIQRGNATLEFEDGDALSVPFEALFANKIAALLDDFFHEVKEDVQTQFVLVPSLEDATAEWVYPQAPFQDRLFGKAGKILKISGGQDVKVGTLGLGEIEVGAPNNNNNNNSSSRPYRRVHCVSNPCTLQVNEIVIGVTGTDAIFHMSADETNGNLVPGSRLARISQHMLQQQSYYPLFPPSLGTNLDLKHMKQWSMPCQPDLLIVPSKLTTFARPVLGSTVVVNPGQLTKNTTGGTYAIMDIHPMKRETLENAGGDDVELEHNLAERIRLEIKKI